MPQLNVQYALHRCRLFQTGLATEGAVDSGERERERGAYPDIWLIQWPGSVTLINVLWFLELARISSFLKRRENGSGMFIHQIIRCPV